MAKQKQSGRRVLLIDDTVSIHEDVQKALSHSSVSANEAVDELEGQLFEDGEEQVSGQTGSQHTYSLSAYSGGAEGFAAFEAAQGTEGFHLAIVDYRMPGGWDGVMTIEKLWSVQADLPVLLCTAYSDEESENKIKSGLKGKGPWALLHKPFNPAELKEAIEALLG